MKIAPLVSSSLFLAKVEDKQKPKNNPTPREPSPIETLFLLLFSEMESLKKFGKPNS